MSSETDNVVSEPLSVSFETDKSSNSTTRPLSPVPPVLQLRSRPQRSAAANPQDGVVETADVNLDPNPRSGGSKRYKVIIDYNHMKYS